jgi:hypothetical protein
MRTRRLKLTSWALMTGIAAIGIVASGAFDRVDAVTINLYDGSSGVTPNNVANPYLAFAGLGSTQSASGGVTTLNTSGSQSLLAGYSNYNPNLTSFVNPLFPILNRNTGYTLSFTMKLNSQTNNSPNRAGFNALILGSDKKGIEIGFKQSDIFAYNNSANLQAGESSTNLTGLISTLNTYNLNILGDSYTLKNNNNTLLTGLLRDYTGVVNQSNPLTYVYGTPNLLFLGDDRTTAGASVDIKNISLTTANTPVPEPSSMAGVAVAIGCGVMFKRKLRKADKLILEVKK